MKKQLLLAVCLVSIVQPTMTKVVDIGNSDFVFPAIAVETETITPDQSFASSDKLPDKIKQKLDDIIVQRKKLIDSIVGTSNMPYSQFKDEATRDKELFKTSNIKPFESRSNYVFTLPELEGYVLKTVRPGNRLINAICKMGLEGELNDAKTDKDYETLFKKMDDLALKPELKLYETYQAASALGSLDRIKKAKKEYSLDRIIPAPTYLYLLDSKKPPYDRNVIVVQKFIKGDKLSDPDLLERISRWPKQKKRFIRLLEQLFVLILAAKLWSIDDIMVTENLKAMPIKLAPIDIEKRDRYVKSFISIPEAKHLAQVAFEKMAAVLKNYPEFFDAWEDLILRDKELKAVLWEAPHVAKLYPRLVKEKELSLRPSSQIA